MWAETGGSEGESPSGRSGAGVTLAARTRVGPYEVLGPLGVGGMGEVYRARDERLSRSVALKVLPGEISADAGRLKRLEKEARAQGSAHHAGRPVLCLHLRQRFGGRSHDDGYRQELVEMKFDQAVRDQSAGSGTTLLRAERYGGHAR